MFTYIEVFFIVVIASSIVGYISYCYAEFKIIARMLDELSDAELAKLTKEIEEMSIIADVISEADKTEPKSKILVQEASKAVNLKMVKQETINGMIFFYDMSGNFICQGASIEQAVAVYELSNKAKTNTCVIGDDGKQFYIINGKIESSLTL